MKRKNKICLSCKLEYPSEYFKKYGLICIVCKDSVYRKCKQCNEVKLKEEFFYSGKYLRGKCKKCFILNNYKWNKNNPDKYKESRKKYYKLFTKTLKAKTGRLKSRLKEKFNLNIPLEEVREHIYSLYGTGINCCYCSLPVAIDNINFDHKIAVSRGGDPGLDNIHIVCSRDNRAKGVFSHNEYLDLLNSVGKEAREILRKRLQASGNIYGRK